MSRIRLYLDEDTIKTALIQALRNADLDVITVADVNRLGLSDQEQLIWATEQGRVIALRASQKSCIQKSKV